MSSSWQRGFDPYSTYDLSSRHGGGFMSSPTVSRYTFDPQPMRSLSDMMGRDTKLSTGLKLSPMAPKSRDFTPISKFGKYPDLFYVFNHFLLECS